MDKLLVILGPTSSGKTDIALSLAKKFNGELISCDSRQVYKGLDIGTGKLPSQNFDVKIKKFEGFWEIDQIKVWMLDVADPLTRYDVSEFIKDAEKALAQIRKKRKLPIIVCGTGLYLKALIEGLPNLKIPYDKSLREDLEKLDLLKLQEKTYKLVPGIFDKLNNSERNNPRRLVRIIELALSSPLEKTSEESKNFNILKIGLELSKEKLNQRIDTRVLSRLNQGLINEAKKLQSGGLSLKRFRELGLEYGVLADYLEGSIDLPILIESLQTKIHQYAKRQRTWFKKEKNVNWVDVSLNDFENKVENIVAAWYNSESVKKS
jgi:tRNA dimethylallyltransferase